MQVSVETINGTLCTIIRRPFDAEAVRKSLAIGVPVVSECYGQRKILLDTLSENSNVGVMHSREQGYTRLGLSHFTHTLTILPALPKRPKPEDVALLYRYAAEGLFPYIKDHPHPDDKEESGTFLFYKRGFYTTGGKAWEPEITHAETQYGNRVDVAIGE